MRIMTLRRSIDRSPEVEVHLELGAALRAAAYNLFMDGLLVLVGILIHRAFIHWTGC